MRVFLAVVDDRPDDRARLAELSEVVKAAGHEPVDPSRGAEGVAGSDVVVALLDGAAPDARVAFALGLASARGMGALGLRSDAREPAGGREALRSQLALARLECGEWKALEGALFDFLTRPALAAREVLVRDGVPTKLRNEGAVFDLRRVEGGERASAIKRRLLHESERLLAAVEGDEREHLAEILELAETLIEERHYDPAGVKRIKERAEASDGAYTYGYVVRSR